MTRSADIRDEPCWAIQTDEHRIISTWSEIQPPIIAEGWAPIFQEDLDFFTLLFFCDAASIQLNGLSISGHPYLRDIWKKSIGDDRSSCVFALTETMISVPRT